MWDNSINWHSYMKSISNSKKEKSYTFCLQEFLPMLRYLFLKSQNRRQCWTARPITKPKRSANLPWSVRLEWLRSPRAVSRSVTEISSINFGHRCSQAARTSSWLIVLVWFDLRLSLALCKVSKLPHMAVKRKVHIFTQKSFFRKRF